MRKPIIVYRPKQTPSSTAPSSTHTVLSETVTEHCSKAVSAAVLSPTINSTHWEVLVSRVRDAWNSVGSQQQTSMIPRILHPRILPGFQSACFHPSCRSLQTCSSSRASRPSLLVKSQSPAEVACCLLPYPESCDPACMTSSVTSAIVLKHPRYIAETRLPFPTATQPDLPSNAGAIEFAQITMLSWPHA